MGEPDAVRLDDGGVLSAAHDDALLQLAQEAVAFAEHFESRRVE